MKKFFKILTKSVLWSVAVVALIAGVLIIRAYTQSQNSFWVDDNLSENVTVRWYYKKHEYRLYNYEEKKIYHSGIWLAFTFLCKNCKSAAGNV